jgi:hypothetical protein
MLTSLVHHIEIVEEPCYRERLPETLNYDWTITLPVPKKKIREESDFYQGVNQWLKAREWKLYSAFEINVLHLKCKPDALGIKLIDEEVTEVVAVEVEGSLRKWMEGLGQAALYQSFSQYAYLAIPTYPWHKPREETEFLKTIVFPACKKLGLGLLGLDGEKATVENELLSPLRQSPSIPVRGLPLFLQSKGNE